MVNHANVFSRAILWVTHPKIVWLRIGGMLVLERQLFTLSRAGLSSVFISMPEPEPPQLAALRLPPGLDVRWVTKGTAALTECDPPYLGISADHFIRVPTLAHIARQTFPTSVSYTDASSLNVVQVVLVRDESTARVKQPLPDDSSLRLDAPLSEGPIDWLMLAGPKPQDGFMARHFDRHLSLAASRALLNSTITPNQMTLFSTILGLIGASFFLGAGRFYYVTGALLIWLHSVLDGCDGELARIRFQESNIGSDLDFWGDNLVHFALFTSLGVGLWLTGNGTHTLTLAAIADIGVLASAWAAWRHRHSQREGSSLSPEAGVVEQTAGDGLNAQLSRLENMLAQRDFIYLLVLLAFVDMVYEFLWAAAIGGCLFFAIMMYLRRVNHNEQARHPHPASQG